MALSDEQKKKIEEEERYRAEIRNPSFSSPQHAQKNGVPALLSLFIPGLGQIVKGQTGRGIAILVGTIIGYFIFVIPGLIIHIWQIADAYNN